MSGKNWKENLRVKLSQAQEKGLKITAVATAIGVSQQSLSGFLSRGYLGDEKAELLEKWLQDAGFIDDELDNRDGQQAPPAPLEPGDQMLAECVQVLSGAIPMISNANHPRAARTDLLETTARTILALIDEAQAKGLIEPADQD